MSSFGGAYGKTTSDYVIAVKDAIDTMNANLPEITIKDEEDDSNVSFLFYYIVNNKLYSMSAVCP